MSEVISLREKVAQVELEAHVYRAGSKNVTEQVDIAIEPAP
jgi:hypothetical protein